MKIRYNTSFPGRGKRLEQTKKVAYNFSMKQIILGALAHVDAGKTTLSESLLINPIKSENAAASITRILSSITTIRSAAGGLRSS